MDKIVAEARRLEHERLERGEEPNPSLTSPEEARKYGWEITGREVKKLQAPEYLIPESRAVQREEKHGVTLKTVPAAKGKVTLAQVMAAIESGDYMGFCLACGAEQEGVEPDARRYTCESCGEKKVYGAEELLIMNVA